MITCAIIDDEPLAREGIGNYVQDIPFLKLVATCQNPVELLGVLETTRVDLLFLDIQMPKMSGIDLIKILQNPPMVIVTTAFPSYALESFGLNVLDYLLKPVTFDRFFKAANKAKEYHGLIHRPLPDSTTKAEPEVDYFFIKCGNKYEKIQFTDILYIQGMQNYVTIYTCKGKYVTLLCLKTLEENLDHKAFIRVHKSYIVAVSKIEGIEGNEIKIQSFRIPISRNYHEQVIEDVVKNKLWIK
jgi:DNA-binding LytR/AlgR family response regulator